MNTLYVGMLIPRQSTQRLFSSSTGISAAFSISANDLWKRVAASWTRNINSSREIVTQKPETALSWTLIDINQDNFYFGHILRNKICHQGTLFGWD